MNRFIILALIFIGSKCSFGYSAEQLDFQAEREKLLRYIEASNYNPSGRQPYDTHFLEALADYQQAAIETRAYLAEFPLENQGKNDLPQVYYEVVKRYNRLFNEHHDNFLKKTIFITYGAVFLGVVTAIGSHHIYKKYITPKFEVFLKKKNWQEGTRRKIVQLGNIIFVIGGSLLPLMITKFLVPFLINEQDRKKLKIYQGISKGMIESYKRQLNKNLEFTASNPIKKLFYNARYDLTGVSFITK